MGRRHSNNCINYFEMYQRIKRGDRIADVAAWAQCGFSWVYEWKKYYMDKWEQENIDVSQMDKRHGDVQCHEKGS